jgi:hypothetical protein
MIDKLEPDFNFWIPLDEDIEKSKKNDKGEVKEMRVKGVASTPDEDSDGEELIPIGFDLSRFLNNGYINWNHQSKNDPNKIIGEPDVAKITEDGSLYIEGVLYPESDLAKSVWKLGETLKKSSKTRKLGWSIEGRAMERDSLNPKRITKALITGVAITPTPVNGSTYMDLCKGEQKEDFVNYDFKDELLKKAENSKYLYEFRTDSGLFGITKSFSVDLIEKSDNKKDYSVIEIKCDPKSINDVVNYVGKINGGVSSIFVDGEDYTQKAMDTVATAPLVAESLDKKNKNLEYVKRAIKKGILPIEIVLDINKFGKKIKKY